LKDCGRRRSNAENERRVQSRPAAPGMARGGACRHPQFRPFSDGPGHSRPTGRRWVQEQGVKGASCVLNVISTSYRKPGGNIDTDSQKRGQRMSTDRVAQSIRHTFQQYCCRLFFHQALSPSPVLRCSHLYSRNLLFSDL